MKKIRYTVYISLYNIFLMNNDKYPSQKDNKIINKFINEYTLKNGYFATTLYFKNIDKIKKEIDKNEIINETQSTIYDYLCQNDASDELLSCIICFSRYFYSSANAKILKSKICI